MTSEDKDRRVMIEMWAELREARTALETAEGSGWSRGYAQGFRDGHGTLVDAYRAGWRDCTVMATQYPDSIPCDDEDVMDFFDGWVRRLTGYDGLPEGRLPEGKKRDDEA